MTSFQVGGYRPATVVDFELPKRFGLRQTIGDTLGVGGIMRGLRTIPVLLDVCRDMQELCPDALLLQYVNPMAMLCWAVRRAPATSARSVCAIRCSTPPASSPPTSAWRAAELDYHVAGINHLAFFLRLEREGEDLYPALREVTPPSGNRVRYEALRHLGYFVTESSEHFAEYVPWFIKAARPDLIERFDVPLDEYPRRCEAQIAEWETLRARLRAGGAVTAEPSVEYGADIIRACETGEPFSFNGNVPNTVRRAAARRQPARRLLRRGAVRGVGARDRAAGGRRAARAIWPPSCRPTSTSRAWSSRPRSAGTARRSTMQRCSTRTPPASWRSTTSRSWSTR